MNVLVIGRAKTGTTALSTAVCRSLGAEKLIMEPKSASEFSSAQGESRNCVGKIIYEHFRARPRELDGIVRGDNGLHIDKLVLIDRDFRDEMISRLLYFPKVLAKDRISDQQARAWRDALVDKENHPSDVSFRELCTRFEAIFKIDVWKNIVVQHRNDAVEFRVFRTERIKRDFCLISYEDMIDGNIDGLNSYLGTNVSGPPSEQDLGRFSYTRRSGSYGAWREVFTANDVAILKELLMADLGETYAGEWSLSHPARLNSAHYSRYASKLMGIESDEALEVNGSAPLPN